MCTGRCKKALKCLLNFRIVQVQITGGLLHLICVIFINVQAQCMNTFLKRCCYSVCSYCCRFWGQKKSVEEAVDENSQTITRNLDDDLSFRQKGKKSPPDAADLHSTCQDWEAGNPASVCMLQLKQMHLLVDLFTLNLVLLVLLFKKKKNYSMVTVIASECW